MNHLSVTPYQKYLTILLLITLISLTTVIAVNIKGLYFDTIFRYQALYNSQLDKINHSDNIDTIFIGDSSLGSAIDERHFSDISNLNTLNLSLTGNYGFSGSYNMLKKAHQQHKTIKNVVLMQTIDMYSRPVAFDGYLNTMQGTNDLNELTFNDKSLVLRALTDSIISFDMFQKIVKIYKSGKKPTFTLEDEHLNKKYKRKNPKKYLERKYSHINPEKIQFLKKIDLYSKQNNIHLIYIHGPALGVIKDNSADYLETIRTLLTSEKIGILDAEIRIEEDHLGNTSDHVYPPFKKLYTEKYYQALKEYLQ